MTHEPDKVLRRGWTTGACAAAAAKSACAALLGRGFRDPVSIILPKGEEPSFALEVTAQGEGWAEVGIIKDAGDDPDVTHGALIKAKISKGEAGQGLRFYAGEGVGTITKPGLPLPVGEPAINPVPRLMIDQAITDVLDGAEPDFDVTISIRNGEALALKTWNGRLGIVGGLSVLGTTGIVRPFSCSSWIASIHRGIDVAVATGREHVIAATGSTSEHVARQIYGMSEEDCLDMGDFAGGVLKYLRKHPIAKLTIAGGIGKMTKLAQGAIDLHSGRSQVDFEALAEMSGCAEVLNATTALDAYNICGEPLAAQVAKHARETALGVLKGAPVAVETIVIDRSGNIIARADFE
ncbi:MAG: cobalt-precorrin-5B (C(1))-methyltransferase [Rhodobacteraceae bacterium]|nr:MAG: cobalt-precorrin-5B (C(1))-methyltransferase [Paracoccaceae bacterium]